VTGRNTTFSKACAKSDANFAKFISKALPKTKSPDDMMVYWVKRGRLPGIFPSYKKAAVARFTGEDEKTVYRKCKRGQYQFNADGDILYESVRDRACPKGDA
jgi:hypothetical protein